MCDDVEVEISDYKIKDCEWMHTTGLAPCIGVVISFNGRGFMLHTPDAVVESKSNTDPFFKQVEQEIPRANRGGIYPVVAGGRIENNDVCNAEIKCARQYVLKKISSLDFGQPHECWCPEGYSQNLSLETATNKVEVHTLAESEDDTEGCNKTLSLMHCPLSVSSINDD